MKETENPWTILSSEEKYDNRWINVTEYQVLTPNGNPGIYGKVHFKNTAIGVLPLDAENNTWLVGQYRFTLNQYTWEIPEGGGAEGEDVLEAAKRELEEETGLRAGSWVKLMDFHLSNSVCDEYGHVFLARDLEQHAPMPEDTEQLQVRKVPFAEVLRMVMDSEITDSLSVAAVLKAKILMDAGQL
jgi:8-oxo-dGTP pyrophosphatase MutT (NUDIX family)